MSDSNPIHTGCDRPSWKHSKTKSGSQRYRCPDCGKVWTLNPKTGKGRLIGDRPMTPAERKRRQRQKRKNTETGESKP